MFTPSPLPSQKAASPSFPKYERGQSPHVLLIVPHPPGRRRGDLPDSSGLSPLPPVSDTAREPHSHHTRRPHRGGLPACRGRPLSAAFRWLTRTYRGKQDSAGRCASLATAGLCVLEQNRRATSVQSGRHPRGTTAALTRHREQEKRTSRYPLWPIKPTML